MESMIPPERHDDDADAEIGVDDQEPQLVATRETLETFHDDVRYLWCSDIPVYENPPSALNFLRNHVALSRPCIIRNSILAPERRAPPAASEDDGKGGSDATTTTTTATSCTTSVPLTMTLDDLVRRFPEADDDTDGGNGSSAVPLEESSSLPPLCVDVTPDGHGDCLRRVVAATIDDETAPTEERVFVKPLETTMSLSDFRRRLRNGRAKQYRQQQHEEIDRKEILYTMFETSLGDHQSQDEAESSECLFEDCVLYYSRQNDCLREELSPLWDLKRSLNEGDDDYDDDDDSFLFPRSFPWAEEAFFGQHSGTGAAGPDAVNLWMGDERAVSAMHKDHYENLFYVLSGEKVFGLCPPSDTPFLYEREVPSGRFEVSRCHDSSRSGTNGNEDARTWSVVLDREDDAQEPSKVRWIATDLFGTNPNRRSDDDDEFPLSKYAHPITVTVQAGELLYLPSLWFHRVSQTRETIGINYWYDMNFESPMWCYFHLLQQLRSQQQSTKERD